MALNDDALIIVCSRANSRRVPNKVFRSVCGIPVLSHILNRTQRTGIKTILAIPGEEYNKFKHYIHGREHVEIYCGYSESPLHRMAAVAKEYNPKWVVRVTHDDCIIDPETILELLSRCKDVDADYGISDGIIDGGGVEVIKTENLLQAAIERVEPTEFVSYFVKRGNIIRLKPRKSIQRPYRLTLDYEADFLLLECVMRGVGADAELDRIAYYLDRRPELLSYNRLPALSIYTCAKNASKYVGECIDSILSLDIPSMEYIFVDDCSTDDTLEIAIKHQDKSRMKIIVNETNVGLASSSNIALNNCKGKNVMRVDADDRLAVNFEFGYSEIINKIGREFDAVYNGYSELGDDWMSYGEHPSINHHVGGTIFSKSFIDELRFKEGLKHWDGLELHKRIMEAKGRIGYQETQMWVYRKHSESMSNSEPKKRSKLKKEIIGGIKK